TVQSRCGQDREESHPCRRTEREGGFRDTGGQFQRVACIVGLEFEDNVRMNRASEPPRNWKPICASAETVFKPTGAVRCRYLRQVSKIRKRKSRPRRSCFTNHVHVPARSLKGRDKAVWIRQNSQPRRR